MDLFVGIDPGQTGGIVVITEGEVQQCTAMPGTEQDIMLVLDQYASSKTIAVIEKVHAMPKQGVSSSFKFGMNYGFLRGCLVSLGISFTEVTPRTWMKALGIRTRKKTESTSQWKNFLKQQAQQRYPGVSINRKTADAVLIATYCHQQYLNYEMAR